MCGRVGSLLLFFLFITREEGMQAWASHIKPPLFLILIPHSHSLSQILDPYVSFPSLRNTYDYHPRDEEHTPDHSFRDLSSWPFCFVALSPCWPSGRAYRDCSLEGGQKTKTEKTVTPASAPGPTSSDLISYQAPPFDNSVARGWQSNH